MQKTISFGKRKVTKVNYSRCVSLPKVMLQNMGIDVDDYLEFIIGRDGTYQIRPMKVSSADVKSDAKEVQ